MLNGSAIPGHDSEAERREERAVEVGKSILGAGSADCWRNVFGAVVLDLVMVG